jgi:predicted amidohydrolase
MTLSKRLRVALCQFQLRDTSSYDELEAHIRDQFSKAWAQRPDLVVFPEFVTFGLLAMAGSGLRYEALEKPMREILAGFTPRYEALFSGLASAHQVHIVGGSHWICPLPQGPGFNTAHLFYPDGRIFRQPKNHLFPGEIDWGTAASDELTVFELLGTRAGLMTCYDSEFPEVGRHLMLNGAQLLITPAATYTRRGYYRVHRCCAARAVENQVYVLECHSVGELSVPVDRPFTAYGRSAVLGPIDDIIQVDDGILSCAPDGETETVVFADLNPALLEKCRTISEATVLKDRNPARYQSNYNLF